MKLISKALIVVVVALLMMSPVVSADEFSGGLIPTEDPGVISSAGAPQEGWFLMALSGVMCMVFRGVGDIYLWTTTGW